MSPPVLSTPRSNAGSADGGGGLKKPVGKLTRYTIFVCIAAAFGGLTFGYDIGVSGGVTSNRDFLKMVRRKKTKMASELRAIAAATRTRPRVVFSSRPTGGGREENLDPRREVASCFCFRSQETMLKAANRVPYRAAWEGGKQSCCEQLVGALPSSFPLSFHLRSKPFSSVLFLFAFFHSQQFFPGVYCAVYDCTSKLDKPPPNPENDPYCKVGMKNVFVSKSLLFLLLLFFYLLLSHPASPFSGFSRFSLPLSLNSQPFLSQLPHKKYSTTTSSCSSSPRPSTSPASSPRCSPAPFAASPGAGRRSPSRASRSASGRR